MKTPTPTADEIAELVAATPERSAASSGEVTESSLQPDEAQRRTRAAVAELSVTQDGFLEIKHGVLGDAALFAFDDGLLVHRFSDGRKRNCPDVEALLTAGWAID